jgi:hypothetical protein
MHQKAVFNPTIKEVSVKLIPDKRLLELSYTEVVESSEDSKQQESRVEQFPYVWLRDSCRCAQCHHTTTHSRAIAMIKFDAKCTARSAEVKAPISTSIN